MKDVWCIQHYLDHTNEWVSDFGYRDNLGNYSYHRTIEASLNIVSFIRGFINGNSSCVFRLWNLETGQTVIV